MAKSKVTPVKYKSYSIEVGCSDESGDVYESYHCDIVSTCPKKAIDAAIAKARICYDGMAEYNVSKLEETNCDVTVVT